MLYFYILTFSINAIAYYVFQTDFVVGEHHTSKQAYVTINIINRVW